MNTSHRRAAEKKWHRKAWMVNPNKTRVIFSGKANVKPKRMLSWVLKDLNASPKNDRLLQKLNGSVFGISHDGAASLKENDTKSMNDTTEHGVLSIIVHDLSSMVHDLSKQYVDYSEDKLREV